MCGDLVTLVCFYNHPSRRPNISVEGRSAVPLDYSTAQKGKVEKVDLEVFGKAVCDVLLTDGII